MQKLENEQRVYSLKENFSLLSSVWVKEKEDDKIDKTLQQEFACSAYTDRFFHHAPFCQLFSVTELYNFFSIMVFAN